MMLNARSHPGVAALFVAGLLSAHRAEADVRNEQPSASGNYSLVLDARGDVWAWGGNNAGQLGDGTRVDRTTPGPVTLPTSKRQHVVVVAAGGQSVALLDDGTLLAWGANNVGQVGDGTQIDRLQAVRVVDPSDATGFLTSIRAVATGGGFTLALKRDGHVYSWGANDEGQLGSGAFTVTPRPLPAPVVDLDDVVAIAAGTNNTACALRRDASVWCWGRNNIGQIGDGSSGANKPRPARVEVAPGQPLANVVAVAAGLAHQMALDADGNVWAWGFNQNGQIGNGGTTNQTRAVKIDGLSGVVAISAGNQFSLAVRGDGSAWAWGRNASGQLGDGTTTNRPTPVQVLDARQPQGTLHGVTALAAGGTHTVAVTDEGAVLCWGSKGVGQLGDGSAAFSLVPVAVLAPGGAGGLDGISAVYASGAVSMARTTSDTLLAWGANGFGNLGDGTVLDQVTPVSVVDQSTSAPLAAVTGVGPNGVHALALLADQTVRAWGINSEGQLGSGALPSTTFAFTTPAISGVLGVWAAGQFSLAVKTDGTAWGWGQNTGGQLGIGFTSSRALLPQQVKDPSDSSSFLQGVAQITAGGNFTVARKTDGTVWAWGQNNLGQLGNGNNTPRTTPSQVLGLVNVSAVASGGGFTLALQDGTVWAWGINNTGQLGDGTTANRNVPVQVAGLSNVTAIAAGGGFGLALLADHTVVGWGLNSAGQLADGTQTQRLSPVLVGNLSNVIGIAAGGSHGLALHADLTVSAWGFNSNGQLGNGVNPNTLLPVRISFPDR